jgi:hypothetical protein
MTMGGSLSRSGKRSNELLLPGVAKEIASMSTGESTSQPSGVKSQLWEDVPLPLPSQPERTASSS